MYKRYKSLIKVSTLCLPIAAAGYYTYEQTKKSDIQNQYQNAFKEQLNENMSLKQNKRGTDKIIDFIKEEKDQVKGFYDHEKEKLKRDVSNIGSFIIEEKKDVQGFFEFETKQLIQDTKDFMNSTDESLILQVTKYVNEEASRILKEESERIKQDSIDLMQQYLQSRQQPGEYLIQQFNKITSNSSDSNETKMKHFQRIIYQTLIIQASQINKFVLDTQQQINDFANEEKQLISLAQKDINQQKEEVKQFFQYEQDLISSDKQKIIDYYQHQSKQIAESLVGNLQFQKEINSQRLETLKNEVINKKEQIDQSYHNSKEKINNTVNQILDTYNLNIKKFKGNLKSDDLEDARKQAIYSEYSKTFQQTTE